MTPTDWIALLGIAAVQLTAMVGFMLNIQGRLSRIEGKLGIGGGD